MNKKILAILMALLMVLVNVAAFAEGYTNPISTESFVINKTYEGNKDSVVAPNEVFNFSVTKVNGTTADITATAATEAITADGQKHVTSAISLASLTALGTYEYSITEVEPTTKTAGVDYNTGDSKTYDLKVTVVSKLDPTTGVPTGETLRVVSLKNTAGGKVSNAQGTAPAIDFKNKYSAGSLKITNSTEGNMATLTDTFGYTVTFTPAAGTQILSDIKYTAPKGVTVTKAADSYTYTITGADNADEVVFENLPKTITYTVDTETQAADNTTKEYTIAITPADSSKTIEADAQDTVTFVATKNLEGEVDTGVFTDNMPYFMLMAFVMILAAAVVLKKRTVNE